MTSLVNGSRAVIGSLRRIRIPDRIRNGRLKRMFDFYSNLFDDYYQVTRDVIQDAKDFPLKATVVASSLTTLFVAYKTNPTENDFYDQLNEANDEMGLIDPVVRNESCYQHLFTVNEARNQRILRHFNFTFLSLIWTHDYPKNFGQYKNHCIYLQPSYMSYITERIVDVGIFGRWRILDYKTRNFDINPNEWIKDSQQDNPQESVTKT